MFGLLPSKKQAEKDKKKSMQHKSLFGQMRELSDMTKKKPPTYGQRKRRR